MLEQTSPTWRPVNPRTKKITAGFGETADRVCYSGAPPVPFRSLPCFPARHPRAVLMAPTLHSPKTYAVRRSGPVVRDERRPGLLKGRV
jgi:hypothetical protein